MPSIPLNEDIGFIKPLILEPLTGQISYNRWARNFRVLAGLHGVWELYTGEETVTKKPYLTSYLHEKKRSSAGRGITESEAEFASDDDLQIRLAEYRLDLEEYKDNEKRIGVATSLLAYWVDPSIRGEIQQRGSPKVAWDWLKSQYKLSNNRALEIALTQMECLKLSSCKTIQDYINRLDNLLLDITDAGGQYDDKQLVAKVLRSLTPRYNTFIDQYCYLQNDNASELQYREIVSRLLTFESKLSEYDEQKKTAKEQRKSRDHPIDKDNKRDRLKCTYTPCQKLDHLEDECRMKKRHQDRPRRPTGQLGAVQANAMNNGQANYQDNNNSRRIATFAEPIPMFNRTTAIKPCLFSAPLLSGIPLTSDPRVTNHYRNKLLEGAKGHND